MCDFIHRRLAEHYVENLGLSLTCKNFRILQTKSLNRIPLLIMTQMSCCRAHVKIMKESLKIMCSLQISYLPCQEQAAKHNKTVRMSISLENTLFPCSGIIVHTFCLVVVSSGPIPRAASVRSGATGAEDMWVLIWTCDDL